MEILKTEGNLNNLHRRSPDALPSRPGPSGGHPGTGDEPAGGDRPPDPDCPAGHRTVTNIGPAHLEGLGSLDGVSREKGDLFRNMEGTATALINRDDPFIRTLEADWPGEKVTFSMDRRRILRTTDIRIDAEGTTFRLGMGGGPAERAYLPLREAHAVSNALRRRPVPESSVSKRVPCGKDWVVSSRPGRMTVLPLANGAFLIDDAYNANPASLRAALLTLRDLREPAPGVAVLGDMLELGESSAELHRETGRLLAETGIRRAYLKGAFSGDTARGAWKEGSPRGT